MIKEEYCFYRFYHNFYEVWYGRRKNLDFHDCDWRHVQELMTFRLPTHINVSNIHVISKLTILLKVVQRLFSTIWKLHRVNNKSVNLNLTLHFVITLMCKYMNAVELFYLWWSFWSTNSTRFCQITPSKSSFATTSRSSFFRHVWSKTDKRKTTVFSLRLELYTTLHSLY